VTAHGLQVKIYSLSCSGCSNFSTLEPPASLHELPCTDGSGASFVNKFPNGFSDLAVADDNRAGRSSLTILYVILHRHQLCAVRAMVDVIAPASSVQEPAEKLVQPATEAVALIGSLIMRMHSRFSRYA